MSDVPFATPGSSNYAYKAGVLITPDVDTRVDRNTATRLNDIINVKDWGAKGNGVDDDTDAIQAAIDYAYLNVPTNTPSPFTHGTVVFFPAGTYIISKGGTTPLRVSQPVGMATFLGTTGIELRGAGRDVSVLKGSYSTGQKPSDSPGFLVMAFWADNSIWPPTLLRSMTFWNTSTVIYSGAVYYPQSQSPMAMDCKFIGMIGLVFAGSGTFGGYVSDCVAECTGSLPNADDASRTYPASSIGIWVSQSVVKHCKATGFEIGFAIVGDFNNSGNDCSIYGNRAVRCKWGFSVAYADAANVNGWIEQGCNFIGNYTENCEIGIVPRNVHNTMYAANYFDSTHGPCNPQSISLAWDVSHTVTATTPTAHNIAADITVYIDNAAWVTSTDGTAAIHVTSPTTFTYTGPSSDPGAPNTGTWNYLARGGMSLSNSDTCLIAANYFVGPTYEGNMMTYDAVSGAVFVGNLILACMSPPYWYPWQSWQYTGTEVELEFIQCSGPNVPIPIAKYSSLGASVEEGATATIIDSQAQPSWDGVVPGGFGANHYKVRYDGTNWVRVG